MKIFQHFLRAVCLVSLVNFSASNIYAQENVLPEGVNERSSLAEVLKYLDETGFAHARIGLESDRSSTNPLDGDRRSVRDSAVFTQGFRLAKVNECTLTLRNNNLKILSFGSSADRDDDVILRTFRAKLGDPTLRRFNNVPGDPPYPADLQIKLNKLRYEPAKAPYHHTKNPDTAKVFGSWRTKFKKDKGQDVLFLLVHAYPPEYGMESMRGNTLTFTFDSQEMSERFDAAFRQAIKLCKDK